MDKGQIWIPRVMTKRQINIVYSTALSPNWTSKDRHKAVYVISDIRLNNIINQHWYRHLPVNYTTQHVNMSVANCPISEVVCNYVSSCWWTINSLLLPNKLWFVTIMVGSKIKSGERNRLSFKKYVFVFARCSSCWLRVFSLSGEMRGK